MDFLRRHKLDFIMAGSFVLAVFGIVMMLRSTGRAETVFAQPAFENAAVDGMPPEAITNSGGWSIISDEALPFEVGMMNCPKAEDDGLVVWLLNPEGNPVWLRMEVEDSSGAQLAKTGLLKPGQCLTSVPGAFSVGSDIVIRIISYEPGLYYSRGNFTVRTQVS